MSATTGKVGKRPQNCSVPVPTSGSLSESIDVPTLSEAATYLRAAEADVLRLANLQELPGRQIGGEWRFLKAGVQDWLRTPPPKIGQGGAASSCRRGEG
jgi:excisionase family DNA binding protein